MATAATIARRSPLPTIGLAIIAGLVLTGSGCKEQAPKQTSSAAHDERPIESEDSPHPSAFNEFGEVLPPDQPSDLAGLTWRIPEGWSRVFELIAARLETWETPSDDPSIQAFAFYFGQDTPRVIERGIQRWRAQLRLADGTNPEPEIETWQQEGLTITVATFTGQTLMGFPTGEAPPRPDEARLVGAIVQGGSVGSAYFRLSGSTGSVESLTPGFLGMLRTIRISETPLTP